MTRNYSISFIAIIMIAIVMGILVIEYSIHTVILLTIPIILKLLLTFYKFSNNKIDIFLYGFFATTPLVGYGLIIAGSFTIQLSYLFSLILIIIMFLSILMKNKVYKIPKSPVNRALLLFYVICVISIYMSSVIPVREFYGEVPWIRSIKQLIGLTFMVLTYFAIITFVNTEDRLRKSLTIYLFSALVVSLIGIYQFVSLYLNLNLPFENLPINNLSFGGYSTWSGLWMGLPRVSSTLVEPAYLGDYLVTVIPICFGGLFYKEYIFTKNKLIILVMNIIYIGVLVLTFSRAPYLGLLFSLILMIILVKKFNIIIIFGKMIKILFILIIIGALLSLILRVNIFEFISERILSIGLESNEVSVRERVSKSIAAVNIFKDYPLLGVGFGNFGFYYFDYAPRIEITEVISGFPTAHNLFGEIISETGALGFILFCFTLFYTLKEGLQSYIKADDNFLRASGLGLISAFGGYLIALFSVDIIYILPFMWVLMGLIVAQKNCNEQIRKTKSA